MLNLPPVPRRKVSAPEFISRRLAVLRSDMEAFLAATGYDHGRFPLDAFMCINYGLRVLHGLASDFDHTPEEPNIVIDCDPAPTAADRAEYLAKAWDIVAEYAPKFGRNIIAPITGTPPEKQ